MISKIDKNISSDSSFHWFLINKIRLNNYRFILNIDNFLFSQKNSYPQLYHWLLSLIRPEKIFYYNKILKFVLFLIQSFIFLLLINLSEKYLDYKITFFPIMLGLVLVYFNPFNFDSSNAKNINLSPRMLGVVIGQLFLCFITSYHLTGNFILLIIISITVPLVILSSQFTLQFILILLIVHLLLLETKIIIAYLFGIFLTLLLVDNQYLLYYLKGQLKHKLFYYNKLAGLFILKVRYSIWRDFVYDFWIKPKNKSFILYFYNNPIIQAIVGFPLLLFFVINDFQNMVNNGYNQKFILFYAPILLCLFSFFVTSFRKTRFLGEPQRYLDFATPFLVALFVTNYHENLFIAYLSLALFIVCLFSGDLISNKVSIIKNSKVRSIYKVKTYIANQSTNNKHVIFCNNLNITKQLLDVNNIYFWGFINVNKIGNYIFEEIFEEYPIVSNGIIPELIDSFKVDTVIIDTSVKSYNKSVINNINQKIKLAVKEGPLEIYNII